MSKKNTKIGDGLYNFGQGFSATGSHFEARYGTDKPKDYHYSEDRFLSELKRHIDDTNQSHYSGQVQPTEFIMSHAETLDFLVGNVMKYTFRFGRKYGYNEVDLYKAAHYLAMMAHYADHFKWGDSQKCQEPKKTKSPSKGAKEKKGSSSRLKKNSKKN